MLVGGSGRHVGLIPKTLALVFCLVLVISGGSTSPTSTHAVDSDRSNSDSGPLPAQTEWHMENFTKTAQFFASLQGVDGGMMEAEDNPFENTDNTLESIWVWCRYFEITGDNTYYQNVLDAWNYSILHPAWLEDDSGKVYSSSWALAAEQRFRTVYNDLSYSWYANASMQFITNVTGWEPAFFTAVTKVHIRGWAAGNVYRYALFSGNQTARSLALQLGNLTMASIEANPTYLSTQGWALAGGTSMWGIWQSSMQEYANVTWMQTYGPLLSTEVTTPGMGGGNSQVGWESWYAGGHLGIWDITGEDIYYLNFLNITDRQMAADGDDDGGLPTNYGDPDNTDESWVTSYRAYMILDEFNKMPSGNPPETADLQKVELSVSQQDVVLEWSLSPDDGGGEADVFVYEIYLGRNSLFCGYGSFNTTPIGVVFAGTTSFVHVGGGMDPDNLFYYITARDFQGWRNTSRVVGGKCHIMTASNENLVSIPFQTSYTDPVSMLQLQQDGALWAYDTGDQLNPWKSYSPSKPFNDLTYVNQSMGIWVFTPESGIWTVTGIVQPQISIQIKAGWNLIGFPSMTQRTVGNFLSGISYDRVEAYAPSGPFNLQKVNDTHLLTAGEALWVHALADGTIQIQN